MFPRETIEAACESYLRDQPRRRPAPGDIASRASGWQQQRARQNLGGEGSTAEQRRVVEWAVMTGRLDREDAWEAVASDVDGPEWLPSEEVQRCVYAVRHHPNVRDADPDGVRDYRRMLKT
jgi:hypothetical protein